MSARTPGPWSVRDGTVIGAVGCRPQRYPEEFASYGGALVAESIETEDARLVAAAPDLLEALQKAFGQMGWHGFGPDKDRYYCEHCGADHVDSDLMPHKPDCAFSLALAAIRKATGGAA